MRSSTIDNGDRAAIRKRLRQRRRALSPNERLRAEALVSRRLSRLPSVQRARNVAVYLAIDGELGLDSFIAQATRRRQHLFAPVIFGDEMQFRLLAADTSMRPNRFGIPEPSHGPYIDARSLDVVLTPLVAFDETGVRLGIGGGYYDRCFRYLQLRAIWRKPKLIGVGFEFQCVDKLDARDWDVGLAAAVTETMSRVF